MRFKVEYIKFKEEENIIEKLCIVDNYFQVFYSMNKIEDVNDIVDMLNIANNVLGDEFEATYEDRI